MEEAFYGWISAQPYVLCEGVSPQFDLPLDAFLPAAPVARLLWPTWHLKLPFALDLYQRMRASRPQDSICFLCAETDIVFALEKAGVPAVLCSHNALVDERVFDLRPEVPKRHDAVYNARMAPWKRHALACDVPSLLLIGGIRMPSEDSVPYWYFLRDLMPDAQVAYEIDEPPLTERQVADALAQCRVGLALSAEEGQMYACMEYLLCGLAVVSTPSVGGRALWLEDDFARTVDAEPAAVARAVRDFVAQPPAPQRVRARTLERMQVHRQVLFDVVDAIYAKAGVHRSYAREFNRQFFSKLVRWRSVCDVMRHVAGDCVGTPL